MSFPSLMLRLFLCVALAVSGVSTARAGMHLEHGGVSETGPRAAADAAAATEATAGMPCHGAGQDDAADPPKAGGHGQDGGKAPAPDCCKGGCQCACVHATPAIAMLAFPALVVHAAAGRRGTTAHAPPRAPRLNRPPIG